MKLNLYQLVRLNPQFLVAILSSVDIVIRYYKATVIRYNDSFYPDFRILFCQSCILTIYKLWVIVSYAIRREGIIQPFIIAKDTYEMGINSLIWLTASFNRC